MKSDQQEIADRAYRLWESRGKPDGEADAIWLEAEQSLNNQDHETKITMESSPLPGAADASQTSHPEPHAASHERWHAVGIERDAEPLDERSAKVSEKLVRR